MGRVREDGKRFTVLGRVETQRNIFSVLGRVREARKQIYCVRKSTRGKGTDSVSWAEYEVQKNIFSVVESKSFK